MILPTDHVLRAVISARLPVPLLLLFCFWCYLFHAVMLPYQVGDAPLTCVIAVNYASGIHVASSYCWLASFFACLFEMTNFAAKHSIMTPEMVENFCNDYYILDEVHPMAPGRDNTITQFLEGKVEIGLLDFIKTADPRKVRTVEVQKKDDQVNLLESTSHCFMSLVTLVAGGSSSAAAPEVSAPAKVEPENVVPEDTYVDLTKPDMDQAVARPDEVAMIQVGKSKRKRLAKQSDALPAKQLRKDHPSLATGTVFLFDNARTADVPVYTTAATVTSARENVGITPMSDVVRSSQLETSKGSNDSFYELPALNSAEAKRWYVPRWNITNDSLLDDGFSCHTLVDRVAPPGFFSILRSMDYEQLYTEFNVGVARQICLGSEVRSHAEHELELKEKLKGRYDARGRLLEVKDLEILRLKYLLAEETERAERAETAEVVHFCDQVSVLTAEVSALKITIAQKDTVISLLDSHATHLKFTLDDSQAACAKAGSLITSLTFEKDRLSSEDFKEKAEAQQEEQAQVLYNCVAELKAHVTDIFGRLEGEFYPAYLTTLAGRRWFLTHGIQLAMLKCFKSPEYQGILGHALGRAIDFGMQEGLEAEYEHGVAGTQLSVVGAYNPEAARTSYLDAVRALEDVDFPLVNFLKSKKDAGMDEVLDCFILDGPLADLPEAAHLQPCLEQLSVLIHHSNDKVIVGETSLSFSLLNVHSRAEGARKHDAALRQLKMEIVSNPLSSRTWVGETSTSVAPLSVEEFDEEDTDEALGSVVAIPKFEACRFLVEL
ncbi:hypothetical protein Tco_0144018 [Tanacetum coccineum]